MNRAKYSLREFSRNTHFFINIRYVRTRSTEMCIKEGDSWLHTDIPSSLSPLLCSPLLCSPPPASRHPQRTARPSRLWRAFASGLPPAGTVAEDRALVDRTYAGQGKRSTPHRRRPELIPAHRSHSVARLRCRNWNIAAQLVCHRRKDEPPRATKYSLIIPPIRRIVAHASSSACASRSSAAPSALAVMIRYSWAASGSVLERRAFSSPVSVFGAISRRPC